MSVFEEACYLSNQRWVNALPTEFEPVVFSKGHQKRMKILFDKMRRDKYHRFTKKATIALIAAIIVISMTITAFAIPATRDFIIQRFFDHSTYAVVSGEQNNVGNLEMGYIPEGFEKTYVYRKNYETIVNYKTIRENYWFEVKQMSLSFNTDFDTESYDCDIIHNSNGIDYIYYRNGNADAILWNNGKYAYSLSGNISKEELLKIAYSVTE